MEPTTLGQRIHQARINCLHSDLFEFARRANISVDGLYAIELDRMPVSREILGRLAKAADVSPEWLQGDSDDQPEAQPETQPETVNGADEEVVADHTDGEAAVGQEQVPDLKGYADRTWRLIREMSEINVGTGNPQEIYVTEECSELVKELMKKLRRKSDEDALVDEACDVLLTTLTLLYQHGVGWDAVLDHFRRKIDRAKDRIKAGEI